MQVRPECTRPLVRDQGVRIALDRRLRSPGLALQLWLFAMLIMLAALAASRPARASEYGVSSYRPGLMDLYSGYLVPPGGTLLKSQFLFQDVHGDATTEDGRFSASTHTLSYTEAVVILHVTRFSLLGAYWGFGAVVQVRLADQTLRAGPRGLPSPTQTSTVAGLGDLEPIPLMLSWNFGRLHIMTALSFYAPTGSYDADRIISVGDNRWAVEPDVGVTWMDERTGRQASAFIGYTINTENTATHYLSGQEFHADFAVVQHLSRERLFGFAGYAFQQTTPDRGSGDSLGPFRGRVLGLGPLVGKTFHFGELPIGLVAKYIVEFEAQNRSSGNELWLNGVVHF